MFVILDFDRCLGDVDALSDHWATTLEKNGIMSVSETYSLKSVVESSGGSFDAVGYLLGAGHLNESQFDKVRREFIETADRERMRMPGVEELLMFLQERSLPYGIVTYGGVQWQTMKLEAAGLAQVPHIITSVKHKSRLLVTWWQQDGGFQIPGELGGGRSDGLVLMDDKAVSFDGFPPQPSFGYHVLNLETAVPSQLGGVPANVTRVSSLSEVVQRLQVTL